MTKQAKRTPPTFASDMADAIEKISTALRIVGVAVGELTEATEEIKAAQGLVGRAQMFAPRPASEPTPVPLNPCAICGRRPEVEVYSIIFGGRKVGATVRVFCGEFGKKEHCVVEENYTLKSKEKNARQQVAEMWNAANLKKSQTEKGAEQ